MDWRVCERVRRAVKSMGPFISVHRGHFVGSGPIAVSDRINFVFSEADGVRPPAGQAFVAEK